MEAGTHKAKLIEVGIKATAAGEPRPYLKFSTEQGNIEWSGSLKSEKAEKFCVSTLVTAGFLGDSFNDLKQPNAIATYFAPKNLEIEVEPNDKGYMQVKYVNEFGAPRKSAAKPFVGQVSDKYKGLFAKAKSEAGVTGVTKPNDEAPF